MNQLCSNFYEGKANYQYRLPTGKVFLGICGIITENSHVTVVGYDNIWIRVDAERRSLLRRRSLMSKKEIVVDLNNNDKKRKYHGICMVICHLLK